jgi:glycosyltransferase involved in cell wall biosynthesis
MARVLYISYTGLLQPLGASQVVAYLRELARAHKIDLVSFERGADLENTAAVESMSNSLLAAGIEWQPLRYHKRPPGLATLYDIVRGLVRCFSLARRGKAEIVHCRSYVPAVIGLCLKQALGVSFLFDMRGFWADERVDGNIWKRDSISYRLAKWFERRFLLSADSVVSLTQAGVAELQQLDYLQDVETMYTIIPTCADLSRFRPLPQPLKRAGFVLGYLGSAGSWYLFDEVLQGFADLLPIRPDTRLLIVNRGEHEYIRSRLRAHAIPGDSVELLAVNYDEVPETIARMDAGVFLIKPVFSKRASAPTRFAELLGCGKPCLANAGVGDLESIIDVDRVGVCLPDTSRENVLRGLLQLIDKALDPQISERCILSARRRFSLVEGVRAYGGIYRRLLQARVVKGMES